MFREIVSKEPTLPVHVVDLDGVLGNMVDVFVRYMNVVHGFEMKPEDHEHTYDIASLFSEMLGITPAEFHNEITRSGFEQTFKIYPTVENFVSFLKTFNPTGGEYVGEYHVALVTSRLNYWENAFATVKNQCSDLGFDSIHVIDFHICKVDWAKKRFGNVAAIFEDKPSTLQKAIDVGIPAFKSSWGFNEHIDVPAFCLRKDFKNFGE